MTFSSLPLDLLEKQWEEVKGSKYRDLLRLALVRDFNRVVHAGLSGVMAEPRTPASSPDGFRNLSARLDRLRDMAHFDFSFRSLLTDPGSLAAQAAGLSPRAPSAELLDRLGRERLVRYDRTWELALTAQAEKEGWKFWQADSALPLREVGAWNQNLGTRLFPQGVVLFCEKSPVAEPVEINEPNEAPGPTLWPGRWSVVLDPALKIPSKLVSDTVWARVVE